MYELKKMERYLRVNLLGPGPRLMKKEFTRPAQPAAAHELASSHQFVSQTVRGAVSSHCGLSNFCFISSYLTFSNQNAVI